MSSEVVNSDIIASMSETNIRELLLMVMNNKTEEEFITSMIEAIGIERITEIINKYPISEQKNDMSSKIRDYLLNDDTKKYKQHLYESYATWTSPDLKLVMELVRQGVDPNIKAGTGSTALVLYLFENPTAELTDDLKELINLTSYCTLDDIEYPEYTPLHIAVAWENIPVIKEIIASGKYATELKEILTFAVREDETGIFKKLMCSWETFKTLVDAGADINVEDEWEGGSLLDVINSLHATYASDYNKIKEYLINNGVVSKLGKEEDYDY